MNTNIKLFLFLCVLCATVCGASAAEQWTILLRESFLDTTPTNVPPGWNYISPKGSFVATNVAATNAAKYGADVPGFQFDAVGGILTSPVFERGATNISFNSSPEDTNTTYAFDFSMDGGTNWNPAGYLPLDFVRRSYRVPITNWTMNRFRLTIAADGNITRTESYSFDDVMVLGTLDRAIVFDNTNGFSVFLNASTSVTAVLVHATEGVGYTWAWSGDLNGSGDTLAVPDTLELGSYTVEVTVLGGDLAESITEEITFSVVRPPNMYYVNYDLTTPGTGILTTDVPETGVTAGTSVLVTIAPTNGYALLDWLIWRVDVEDPNDPDGIVVASNTAAGTQFTMPDSDVQISATYLHPDYLINFETKWTGASSYAPLSGVVISNSSMTNITWALNGVKRGTLDNDVRNGEAAGCFRTNSPGNDTFIKNEVPFEEPIGRMLFRAAPYGRVATSNLVSVCFSVDNLTWTCDDTNRIWPDETEFGIYRVADIPENSRYVKIGIYGTAKQNIDIDDICLWFGTATLSVAISGVNEGDKIAAGKYLALYATPSDGAPPYVRFWWDVERIEGTGETRRVEGAMCQFDPEEALPGAYKITAYVEDSDGNTASIIRNFTFAPQYALSFWTTGAGTIQTIPTGKTNYFQNDAVQLSFVPSAGYWRGQVGAYRTAATNVSVALNADDTLIMPAGDVTVWATFPRDTVSLPFYYNGPWQGTYPDGMRFSNLGGDYVGLTNYDANGGTWAKVDATNSSILVHFPSNATTMSYFILADSMTENFEFRVQKSTDNVAWTTMETFTQTDLSALQGRTNDVSGGWSYLRFSYVSKDAPAGGIGIGGIYIAEAGAEPGAVGLPIEGTLQMTAAGLNFDLPAEAVLPTAVMRATQVTDRRWDGSNILGTAARIDDGSVIVSNDVDKAVIWLEY